MIEAMYGRVLKRESDERVGKRTYIPFNGGLLVSCMRQTDYWGPPDKAIAALVVD